MTFVDRYPDATRLVKASFIVAFAALGIGGFFGLIQALHRTGVFRGIVSSVQYYDVLTGHGVLLALVFTTFFIVGLYQWGISRSLEREPENMTFTWTWFWVMTVGTVLTAAAILGGLVPGSGMSAAVLYTFYPPLQAHPLFYIGAALLLVGSWLTGVDWFMTFRRWREEHSPKILDNMKLWIGIAILLVLLAYSLPLADMVMDGLFSPGAPPTPV